MKNNFFIKLLFIFFLIVISSCETVDLNQTENPSTSGQSAIDPVYAFNYVQLLLPEFVDSANDFTQRVTRQMAMTGGDTYDNAFQPVNFNNNWSTAYDLLNTVKVMEPKAIQNKEFTALGASKVIRVYVFMTLVDIYGDVPFTQSLLGNDNLTPSYDSGASVYKQLFLDIEEAKKYLDDVQYKDKPNSFVKDLYYGGDRKKWISLANTLKLKMLNNARLAASDIGVASISNEINSILIENNIIDTENEDFSFKYSSSRDVPNSRHPLYNDQYELGGGAYISNYFLWCMTVEKGYIDVRAPFYFYKQSSQISSLDAFTLPGRSRPSHYDDPKYNSFFVPSTKTCYSVSNWLSGNNVTEGFLGRDHGNNSGIPPDTDKRTVAGVYPIGGKYGTFTFSAASVQKSGIDGALGSGIMPIIMSSFVRFIKAEAFLTVPGVSGDPLAELVFGINSSIDRVITPINLGGKSYPVIPSSDLTQITQKRAQYITKISSKFNTSTQNQKLELIIKEFYIASWGNGIEAYNNYRRTGYPSNMQPTLEVNSGTFFYSGLYPSNATSNNPNAPVSDRSKRVFWDKANLILN